MAIIFTHAINPTPRSPNAHAIFASLTVPKYAANKKITLKIQMYVFVAGLNEIRNISLRVIVISHNSGKGKEE